MTRTPARLGFRMPAEWHPHESTWLTWPKDPVTWPERVERVQEAYLEMIARLVPGERVDLLVDDAGTEAEVRGRLAGRVETGRVRFHHIPTADAWIRDYGPNFLISSRGELAMNDWGFNAWGDKYPDLKRDAGVPARLAERLGITRFTPQRVLEGGAIDVNGRGCCLTTELCLLNPNRNPAPEREQIESLLAGHLGVTHVVWLGQGLAGDDTDGHVDCLARFVGERAIVCALEPDPEDENYRALEDNRRRLEAARDPEGRPFEIVSLPMPPRQGSQRRLPASYANFYAANRTVLVPTFGCASDTPALEMIARCFPDREVAGLDARDVIRGMGAWHCLTQQQPAASAPAADC